ncbi:MAG: alkaline phosphatase family protein [Candidatus Eisenbacteria bacterium]|nr:alkaline phosphatase family protein [Candidatus Eisenbacteria bacterium]
MSRLAMIGLDCAAPQLVFERWRDDLPNLRSLMDDGVYGKLRSTIPPITVPAWTSMMTSQDPGQLGFYGFRNRASYDYKDLFFANAKYVKAKTVWNYLSRQRLNSLVFGVPQTYPPKPLKGVMVSSFLTPSKEVQWTHPREAASEVDQAAGGDYMIDVKDFRTDDKDWLLDQIHEMTRRRFSAFRHFVRKKEFDFMAMVEMGIDRMHHGFWRYFDEEHRLYEPGHKYEHAIRDYYKLVDEEIGLLLDDLPRDTSVMVTSDHGARRMDGAICVNEWLIREGLLTLKETPTEPTRLTPDMVNWSKTKAWGEGGYYSRIFLNVEGREPKGKIPSADYDAFRDELKAKIEAIPDEKGNPIGTTVYKPEDIYRVVNGIAPDLIVFFGDLAWRSAGSVGTGAVHIFENDTGPDDANHDWDGIFIWDHPAKVDVKKKDPYSIYDIAPTILRFFNVDIPEHMIGEPLF